MHKKEGRKLRDIKPEAVAAAAASQPVNLAKNKLSCELKSPPPHCIRRRRSNAKPANPSQSTNSSASELRLQK